MIIKVKDDGFKQEVLNSNIPTIVKFYADWCPYCRKFAPVFDQVSTEYEGRVKFIEMDVDSSPEAPKEYKVNTIPTVIIFKDGKKINEYVNPQTEEILKNFLNENL
ncbi:thioredoxin family protein [Clostridium peptidivorans]|uniref:thioredoxin family protein n=1 Tax=Clostridium peptidivorans TaxID=100174 RepID=UPI0015C7B61A|nr:thioredoxin family protein [Clostridium peptidivorans]